VAGRSREVRKWTVLVDHTGTADALRAERALALLALWATRRAQRIAKERSQAAVRNGPRNRQLRPQDGEERT
jgi:hypothetical protein